MSYFSRILAEPEAQQASRMTIDDLLQQNIAGSAIFEPLAKKLGLERWQIEGGVNEGGQAFGSGVADPSLLSGPLAGYTFDWRSSGPGNTGTLSVFDPSGASVGDYFQQDQSDSSAFAEWLALAAAGFGGLGLAGFGPLGSSLGGIFGGAAEAGAGVGAGVGADAGVAFNAGGTGSSAAGGISASGGAGYGTIATAPGVYGGAAGTFAPVLGQGGAALSTGAGLTAPAFAGGGVGIAGGLGMTAGAAGAGGGAGGGLSGLLSTIGGYLPAAQSLASIASGVYGMKLAGDARQASDPFAPYRGAYAQQLAALEANPGSITTRPGFQVGLETIGRKSAASGYYGSGNMASALSRYSGDFYTQEANRLATLAGANQTPGAGQAVSADLAGRSLASIGYGLGPLLQRLGGG